LLITAIVDNGDIVVSINVKIGMLNIVVIGVIIDENHYSDIWYIIRLIVIVSTKVIPSIIEYLLTFALYIFDTYCCVV